MRSFGFLVVVLVAVLVLAGGCNRDRVDSANQPPVSPTTDVGTGTATGTAPSDTSTTTRPAEPVHGDTATAATTTT